MDLLAFSRYCLQLQRVRGAEKAEMAYTMMVAAQGNEKVMKKWVKHLNPALKHTDDQADFLARVGKGI
jgi:hypothetical protein